jgi:hypothetical protein
VFGLNVFSMLVTNVTNAVMRTITEWLTTACIWVARLILFYSIENSGYGQHHPTFGEFWSVWSWLQLVCFGLLVTGMLAYNRTIRLSFFEYKGDQLGDRTKLSREMIQSCQCWHPNHRFWSQGSQFIEGCIGLLSRVRSLLCSFGQKSRAGRNPFIQRLIPIG